MRITCIDPGKSSGIVTAKVIDGVCYLDKVIQYQTDNWLNTLHKIKSVTLNTNVIVVEQFTLHKTPFIPDITPIKIISGLEIFYGNRIFYQTPLQAKTFVDDKTLKNIKYYHTGRQVGCKDANDVNDSLRHLVRYCFFKHKITKFSRDCYKDTGIVYNL